MPYETRWVAPKRALKHQNVSLYHVYKNDNVEEMILGEFYTTNPNGDDNQFDVRKLSTWTEPPHPPFTNTAKNVRDLARLELAWKKYHAAGTEQKHIFKVLRRAIEKGELKAHPDTLKPKH
ncbi:MAG: hypothetical protein KGL39_45370 [Patescibacteria group bacterium]|nr:hypothetical protein [Patescibacteria group bacterium]